MDNVRSVGILLLLVFHATAIPELRLGVQTPPSLVAFNDAVAPFRMPLLMTLSGMLLSRSLRKPAREYYAGKLKGLGWPFVTWSLIYLASIGHLADLIHPGWWIPVIYLWYILFLLIYYLAAPLLIRIQPIFVSVAAFGIGAILLYAERGFYGKFMIFLGYFMLGHVLSSFSFSSERRRLLALISGTILLLVWAVPISIDVTPVVGSVLVGVSSAVFLVSLFGSLRILDRDVFITRLGRNSLVFYVSHYPLIVLLCYVLGSSIWLTGYPWLVWGASLLAAIVVGLVLAKFRESMPISLLFRYP